MKILFLVHRVPYPPNKGDKIRALWELKTLARKHEIDLFCFYDAEEDRESLQALRPYCANCYAERLPWLRSRWNAATALAGGVRSALAFSTPRQWDERSAELSPNEITIWRSPSVRQWRNTWRTVLCRPFWIWWTSIPTNGRNTVNEPSLDPRSFGTSRRGAWPSMSGRWQIVLP